MALVWKCRGLWSISQQYYEVYRVGRDMIRSFEGPLRRRAKLIPTIRKAHDKLVKCYHGALLKGAGVRSRLLKSNSATHTYGVDPSNIIWIFCSSRSGSTLLRSMMAEKQGHKVWEEPKVADSSGISTARPRRVSLPPLTSSWENRPVRGGSSRSELHPGWRSLRPPLPQSRTLPGGQRGGQLGGSAAGHGGFA
jgi:hypothetical protein